MLQCIEYFVFVPCYSVLKICVCTMLQCIENLVFVQCYMLHVTRRFNFPVSFWNENDKSSSTCGTKLWSCFCSNLDFLFNNLFLKCKLLSVKQITHFSNAFLRSGEGGLYGKARSTYDVQLYRWSVGHTPVIYLFLTNWPPVF